MEEQAFVLAQRWALLIDPSAAQSAIERLAKLALPRRICRPLDRKREQIENLELEQFDAAIDATVEVEAEAESEPESIEFAPAQSGN